MRIVDLTMTWPDVPTYPGHPDPMMYRTATFEENGKQVSKLEIGTHSGTHIDAPRHFIKGGATVESIAPEVLCGPAKVVDLTQWEGKVSLSRLREAIGGKPPERLLLRYDGEKMLGSMAYYNCQPWLATDAAAWLVREGCKLVGMDTPMPDRIGETYIHERLLSAGVVIVEYMVNLAAIKADTFDLIVAPLKIRDGDGAPARCFAIVND